MTDVETVEPSEIDTTLEDEPVELRIDPPDIKGGRFGKIGAMWRQYRYQSKLQRLGEKGYVQWYVLNGTWPRARFIKPKTKGGGIPEYKKDGNTYLFPKDAMLPDSQSGLWTVVHKENESDPINLRDPTTHAIQADVLKEYLQLRVTSTPPGFLGDLNITPEKVMMGVVVAIIAIALLSDVLGGGIV